MNQGLFGALVQYWDIQPQARLGRKNTFFEDVKVSNTDALRFGLVVSIVATAIMMSWCIIGGLAV